VIFKKLELQAKAYKKVPNELQKHIEKKYKSVEVIIIIICEVVEAFQ
jgi:hypothetical protein